MDVPQKVTRRPI